MPIKSKKTHAFNIYGAFKVRVSQRKANISLIHSVKRDAVHVRNMVLILRNRLYEANLTSPDIKVIKLAFENKTALRDTIYGRKGNKQADKITLIRDYFKDDALFDALCAFCQRQFDAKSVLSILKKVEAEYGQFYTNIAKYTSNPGVYAKAMGNSGAPRPPKPKKLKSVIKASLMLDGEKWKLVKKHSFHFVKIKIAHKRAVMVPINWSQFRLPKGMEVRSLNVNISNKNVYLDFTYGKLEKIGAELSNTTKERVARHQKWAAGDVGIINLMSVFVEDSSTDSLLMCGRTFKHRNKLFNKRKAKLDRCIADEASAFKTIHRKNDDGSVDNIEIATEHSALCEQLKQHRTHLTERRTRYFESEFNKLSRRLVEYLLAAGVTDFVMSKNLSFLKTSDTQANTLRSSTKQSFYHLPLGRFINLIAEKCEVVGISVHFINEDYTSKTSCLFAHVNDMAELARTKKQSLSTNDCLGGRVKRGLFKDHVQRVEIHADINGAINHINVARGNTDMTWLLHCKAKVCNPVRIKSDYLFHAGSPHEVLVSTICASGHKTKPLIAA